MNPSEAVLYPASYYRDMAFFVTKSITNIFNSLSEDSLSLSSTTTTTSNPRQSTYTLIKSDSPIIAAAIDGHFISEWESQLYQTILTTFQRSMLDESVPIATVVLLDLLGDLHKMGQLVDGNTQFQKFLPTYPDESYLRYFKGAFMLAVRLLTRNKPSCKGFWEYVMDMEDDTVHDMENEFQSMLEQNINYYPPIPFAKDDPAYQFHYAGDLAVPTNAFIPRLRYLHTKSIMYTHIRVLATSRGEILTSSDPRRRKKELPMTVPPCHEYIMTEHVRFQKLKKTEPQLRGATNNQVRRYLDVEKEARKGKPLVGLGIVW